MKLSILLIACAVILASCSEATAPDYTAQKMSLQSLNTTLGYEWFPAEVSAYQPDTAKVSQITGNFNPATDTVYFYVNPSCSCKGTQKLFPHAMRILMDAGVQESHIEIYSMRSSEDKHPHMSRMQVHRLPTIFIMRAGQIAGSFSEQAEGTAVEDLILDALKTN